MSALAIILVLLSALFHALRSLFTKESGDKQIFLWLYSIFALLFFSPLFFYFLLRVGINNPVAYLWCAGIVDCWIRGFLHVDIHRYNCWVGSRIFRRTNRKCINAAGGFLVGDP